MPVTNIEPQRPSQPRIERAERPSKPVSEMTEDVRYEYAMRVVDRVMVRDRALLDRLAR